MHWKHYALLILILLFVTFLQPALVLVGGFAVIAGAWAFIYRELPSRHQDRWDRAISNTLKGLRKSLRKKSAQRERRLAKTDAAPRMVRSKTASLEAETDDS